MKIWVCPQCKGTYECHRLDDLPIGWVIVQTTRDAILSRPSNVFCSKDCADKYYLDMSFGSRIIGDNSDKMN